MSKDDNILLPPTNKIIRKSEDYVVDGLGKVTRLTAIDPEKAKKANEPLVLYSAYAVLGAQVGGQVRPFPVEWLMENVTSLESAFELFQEQAIFQLKQNMEEARQRAEEEQRKIVTAPAGSVPHLLRP